MALQAMKYEKEEICGDSVKCNNIPETETRCTDDVIARMSRVVCVLQMEICTDSFKMRVFRDYT